MAAFSSASEAVFCACVSIWAIVCYEPALPSSVRDRQTQLRPFHPIGRVHFTQGSSRHSGSTFGYQIATSAHKGFGFGRRLFLFRCIRIQEVENGCLKLLVCHFQHIQHVLLCL